jgi:hypothetical protein
MNLLNPKTSPDPDVMDDKLVIFGGCTQLLSPKGSSQSPPAMQSISIPQLLQTPPHQMGTSPIIPSNGSVLFHPQQNSGPGAPSKGGWGSDNTRQEASSSVSAPGSTYVMSNTNDCANAKYGGLKQHLYDDWESVHHMSQPQLLPPPQCTMPSTMPASSSHMWTPPPLIVPSAHLRFQHQNQNQHLPQPHSHPLSFQHSLPLQGDIHMNISADIIPPRMLELPHHPDLQANSPEPHPNPSRSLYYGTFDAAEAPIHHEHNMQTPNPFKQSSPPLQKTFSAIRESAPDIGPVSENSGINQPWMNCLQQPGVLYDRGVWQGS